LEMRVRGKCDDRFMLKITFQLNARGPVDDTKIRLPNLCCYKINLLNATFLIGLHYLGLQIFVG